MKVALPDWNALTKSSKTTTLATVKVVSRVMINISGPDIPTQVRIWSLNDLGYKTGDPVPTPPAAFTFDVRRGSDRLFQVLAIVQEFDTTSTSEGDGDGPMAFYYGDVTKNLSRDVEDIPIQLASQGIVGADQGNITGRYLDSSGVGPTARLNMFYAPPGRPEMIVDTGTMFSGFFDIGLPAVAQFSYRLASGLTLFDKFTINSLDGALGPQLMRLEVPDGFNDRQGTRIARSGRTRLIGFVGPGAAGKTMCYSGSTESLQNLYKSGTVANTERVNWNPTSSFTTDARVVAGGTLLTAPACVAATELGGDHLKLMTQTLAYGDSPVAVRGPFREVSPATNTFLSGLHSGTNLTLTWKYLKPVLGDSVDGVGVFTKTLAAGEVANKRWQDSAPCSTLVSNHGFTELTRVTAGTPAAPLETYVVPNVNATDYSAGKHVTLLCPYSSTRGYYDFGLMHAGPNGGGQQGPPVATKLVAQRILNPLITTAGMRAGVADGACTAIVVRMTDASGINGTRMGGTGQNGLSAQIVGNPSSAMLHSGPSCPSVGSSSSAVTFNGSQHVFWLKLDNTNTDFEIQITDTTIGGTALTPVSFFGVRVASDVPIEGAIAAPASVPAHQCFPVSFLAGKTVAGDFIPMGGSNETFSLTSTLTANAGLAFYTASDCISSSSNPAIFSSQTSIEVWAKYTGAASTITLTPTGSLTTSPATISVMQPGPAATLRVELPPNFGAEACQQAIVKSVDSSGRPAPTGTGGGAATVTFTYNASTTPALNGGMYSDPSCTTPISTIAISNTDTQSSPFYFRWPNQGTVTISGTSSNAQTVASTNVSLGVAALGQLVVTVPGVTWNFAGGYTGAGAQRSQSSASLFDVAIQAITPLGNPLMSFAEANVDNLGISNQAGEFAVCGNYSGFTSGTATAQCYFENTAWAMGFITDFRTGGGSTPYPFYMSNYGQMFVSDPGDVGAGVATTHLFSRPFSYSASSCQPLMVQRRVSGSQYIATPVNTPMPIALMTNANVTNFFSDPSCSTQITNTVIPATYSETVVYIKPNGVGAPTPTADGGAGLEDPYTGSVPTPGTGVAPGAATQYILNSRKIGIFGSCEPVMLVHADANGAAVPVAANKAVALSESGIGAMFYTDRECFGAPTTSVTIPTGASMKVFYYKATILNGGGTGSITATDATPLTGQLPSMTIYN